MQCLIANNMNHNLVIGTNELNRNGMTIEYIIIKVPIRNSSFRKWTKNNEVEEDGNKFTD